MIVVGAGAAGIAAAISAARSGARVILLEAQPRIGGTVTRAHIHTLAGLYDSAGELINQGLAAELEQRLLDADSLTRRRQMGRVWVLNVRPELYGEVVEQWLAEEPRIEVICNAAVAHLEARHERVVELSATTGRGLVRWRPLAVVDATGTAQVVRTLNPDLLAETGPRAAAGWIFRLRGVLPGGLGPFGRLGATRSVRDAAAAGTLPPECDKAWLDSGLYDDELFVKLFIPLGDDWQDEAQQRAVALRAGKTRDAVVALLRQLPGFADVRVTHPGNLGVRDGGGIGGEYRLTKADVLSGRKFPDAACRACWPIEYWDPERGVSLEHLPDGECYEIPLRSLRVAGVTNLWAAGKCLSADKYAQASARVVGTCWAMGDAVGRASTHIDQNLLSHA
jgi:hypothetical protein